MESAKFAGLWAEVLQHIQTSKVTAVQWGIQGSKVNGLDEQKSNVDRSTAVKLVGMHQCSPKVSCTLLISLGRGNNAEDNTAHQDDKSATLSEKNRKKTTVKIKTVKVKDVTKTKKIVLVKEIKIHSNK